MDLKSAVAALQQRRSAHPPPASPALASGNQASTVQQPPSEPPLRDPSVNEGIQGAPPAPPDKPPEDGRPAQPHNASSSSSPPRPAAHPVNVTLPPSTHAHIPPPAPPPAYPHQPYGFAQPTASYPHVPYYGAATTTYNYPHASYPTFPPSVSYSQHARKSPEPFPNLVARQPSDKKIAPEDIPSYEEIIVEALAECADPEGAVPKNIFTWMAARYPLQSNFRPSASQALQKAYKRGRFEKSMTGKYRLNRLWEGVPVRYLSSFRFSDSLILIHIACSGPAPCPATREANHRVHLHPAGQLALHPHAPGKQAIHANAFWPPRALLIPAAGPALPHPPPRRLGGIPLAGRFGGR